MATTKNTNSVDYAALADALHTMANEFAKMNGATAPATDDNDEAQTYSSQIAEKVTGGKSKGTRGTEKSAKSSGGATYTEGYLKGLPIKELRTLGAQEGVESKIKGDIITALTDAPVSGGSSKGEDAEEESSGSEEYTRDDLQEMSTKNLRGVAREYEDYEKGMSRDSMVSLILGSSEDEDSDDDEDEFEDEDEGADEESDSDDSDDDDSDDDEEDEEDEGDDDDEVVVTREELKAMTSKSLKDLHKKYDLKLPKTEGLSKQKVHSALVDSILEQVSDEDDDE